jgi:anti-anti-sigma regulatory factor
LRRIKGFEMPLPDAQLEQLSLSLDPVLDFRAAASPNETLGQGLGWEAPLIIDAGAVTRMSTAGVQVLTALAKALAHLGGRRIPA